jgi:choline dehydrogenase-like flavoprotein
VQDKAKSKKAMIVADTNKEVAVLDANARQIAALPMFVPTLKEAQERLGNTEHAGKEIVATNAAQMVTDYMKGEITKKVAKGNLEVAKINAETDRKVAALDAETNRIRTLPTLTVTKTLAQKCGKPEWENTDVLADNISKTLLENANAEVETMEATAELSVVRAEAAATKAIYEAEGQAAEALRNKRAFELAKRQIDVYQSLANNGKVSLFGSDSGSTVPSMVTIGGNNRGEHNINGGNGPWDTVRQITESIASRIARGPTAEI